MQAEQRPRVPRVPRQVVAEDPFAVRRLAVEKERRAERLADRIEPDRRLVVGHLVAGGHGAPPETNGASPGAARRGDTRIEHERGHGEDRLGALEARATEERLGRDRGGRLRQGDPLRGRLVRLAGARQRDAPGEVPPRDFHGMIGPGCRQREDLLVEAEAQEHRGLHRDHRFDHRHHLRVRGEPLGDLLRNPARRSQTAPHHLRVHQEVQVVRVVGQAVEVVGRHRLQVSAIGLRAGEVGAGSAGVVARAGVDVRRHVREVAGGRRQGGETIGARQRAIGTGRRLHGVDVVMIRPEVIGIAAQHRFEHGRDLLGTFRRRPVEPPQLPRPQVHQALGIQRRGVEVVGEPLRQIAHPVRVLTRERRAVRLGIGREANGHGLDVGALAVRASRRQRERLLHGRKRLHRARVVDVEVVVRAEGPGNAPVRHGGLRIELRRAGERAHRFLVVEAEHQIEALVEELLRLWIGRGDGMVMVAEARHEGRASGLCRGRCRAGWRLFGGSGGASRQQQGRSESHEPERHTTRRGARRL